MSIINKIEHIFSAVLATLAMTATLSGCVDDPIYESVEIPDAEVEIRGEVIYKPLVPTKVQTRAKDAPEGAKYTDIKSLYVFFFDKDKQLVEDYCGKVIFNDASKPENSDKRVTFKKRVKAGQYYVYAVANIPEEMKGDLEKVTTIDELRKFKLVWDDDIEKDLEMFGVFRQVDKKDSPAPSNEDFEKDELITITPDNNSLLSWVRRAVSKVTVDFNGDNLKEGVTVYIKNAVLKNLPSGTFLGADSRIDPETGTFKFAENTDYSITYGNGDSHEGWPEVTKNKTFSPKEIWQDSGIESFHADNARALPCYENLQGEPEGKSKLQDRDEDGIIDSEVCDGVKNGTYLEVEGYYVADRPEYKSEGKIIYRFMLGGNAENNFDVVRNHHYKITMMFKGNGNDVDWHIEYTEKYLDITYPEDVNYQGRFFTPDADFSTSNGGHAFTEQNTITVTSFGTDGKNNTWIEPQIKYTYYKYDYKSDQWVPDETGNWLKPTIPEEPTEDNTQKQYTFVASKTVPENITMNSLLSTASTVGSQGVPYNLSNENGGMNIENTANCYIVGAPGWYCFPLVYGNAIKDGVANGNAYASPHIVNHLKKNITSPYIKDNVGEKMLNADNVSVEIIWRDDENIVKRKTDGGTLEYDATLFGGMGGIKFYIAPGDIKECNVVIALIDKSAKEDELVKCYRDYWPYKYFKEWGWEEYRGSTNAIWSWHIWVTRFGLDEFGKDIPVVNHEGKKFDVMPVNLGWCSGGREFRYYKPRKCVITFTVGDREIEREIIQYPHLLLPRGDHPYYQWGRKDPFVGTNELWTNKKRWSTVVDGKSDFEYYATESGASHPTFLYYNAPNEDKVGNVHNERRKNTKDCLDELIKNPDKWHNCKHETSTTIQPPPGYGLNYYTINEAPDDLWLYNGCKTVYDPCPAGYEVGRGVFTGFTTDGNDQETPGKWNDVLEDNMEQDYYNDGEYSSNSYVIELYTNTRKLQSIAFPITGYRDWDAWAEVIHFPPTSTQLSGDSGLEGRCFVWTSEAKGVNSHGAYYLGIHRPDKTGDNWKDRGEKQKWVNPRLEGPNTDGMAVRPVKSPASQ